TAVRAAVEQGLLVKGGGHAMAAGVTVLKDRLADLVAFLENALGPAVDAARREDILRVDGTVSAGGLNPEFYGEIARAGPFGAGNSEPIFVLPGHILLAAEEIREPHMRLRVRAVDGAQSSAIAFRAVGQP